MADILVAVETYDAWGRVKGAVRHGWPSLPVRAALPVWRAHADVLPDIAPGERVYLVYRHLLRGYAPLSSLRRTEAGELRFRLNTAGWQPCTLPWAWSFNFRRGWRYARFGRSRLLPFPDWAYAATLPHPAVAAGKNERSVHGIAAG